MKEELTMLNSLARAARQVGSAILLAAVAAGCGSNARPPTSPSSQPLSQSLESPAYLFRYAPGDSVDSSWQQAFHDWAVAALDVPVTKKVTYNKYLSRTHMGDLTGEYDANAYADPKTFTVHTIWASDNHEVVHLYSSLFGSPVALFNEGLAVAHQVDPVHGDLTPRWNMTPLHDHARSFRRQGMLVALGSLLASNDFRRFDSNVTYPEAGSFVRYVLDTYGLGSMKRFFALCRNTDSADTVRQQFQTAFGRSVTDVEHDWWAMLDAR
jgi:hypothetical protein